MHSYLRAIGFSNLKKKEWQEIVNEVICDYDEKEMFTHDDGTNFVEMSKSYGEHIGITVCGEYDDADVFVLEYAFPYCRSFQITTTEDVFVERRSEKECYSGACEDMRVGVTLIFYLANAGAYLKQQYKQHLGQYQSAVSISGLSLEGKIILPIKKNAIEVESEHQKWMKRESAWNALDDEEEEQEFFEKIAREDIEEFANLHKRVMENDILTVVDTFFIPYGMECDRYHILGEITSVETIKNRGTEEELYQLSVLCNDMEFGVCINKSDLLGEPQVGRRFKGIIWAQGELQFRD